MFQRQGHSEFRAFAQFAFKLNCPIHCGDNVFYNGKTKARTADIFVTGFIHHIKTLEDFFLMMWCNADTCILYCKDRILAIFTVTEGYLHPAFSFVVFYRIGDKVAAQIPKLLIVCNYSDILCVAGKCQLFLLYNRL